MFRSECSCQPRRVTQPLHDVQALAEAGGVFISGEAHQYARKVLPMLYYRDFRHQTGKNIEELLEPIPWACALPRPNYQESIIGGFLLNDGAGREGILRLLKTTQRDPAFSAPEPALRQPSC